MSTSLYDPDADAVPNDLDYVKLLSQRDLSSTIPINFVTVPGVSISAACFPRKRYDSASATKCVSNLLAAGFRRLEVDLYWDVSRTSWSFCPVQLGEIEPQLSVTQDSTTSQTRSASASLASNDLGARDLASSTPVPAGGKNLVLHKLKPRQTGGTSALTQISRSSASASTIPSATTTQTAALPDGSSTAVNTGPNPESNDAPDDGTLLKVGEYVCSTQLDFHQFLEVLYGHFVNTEDNLNATIKYIILNIHAASSVSASAEYDATPSLDNLPQGNNLLSSLISANNSQYLYTPQLLDDQRSDLNKPTSWFTVRQSITPDSTFYQVDRSSNNIVSTPDGWPSESVVEFARARRMLAGFGNIDPEMQGYDISRDASTIFAPGYLQDARNITLASNGSVTSGCFFNPDEGEASVANANSSWATSNNLAQNPALDASLDISLAQASNITACGISPILNTTLSDTTADTNPLPYKSYVQSTIWSWAANEPKTLDANAQEPNPDDDAPDITYRCAVLNATSSHWQSRDCSASHHAACRVDDASPYSFRISDSSAAYAKAEDACRNGIAFAAARSALENAFLTHAWRQYRSENNIDDELLWVDFNDLDIAGCWVIGQNSTCPYQDQQVGEGRRVVVPVVAAVIVFVLAILTIFIKCASNRRNTRRRRKRVDDGWDYEGVPS
ncbi:hypothetical protein Q7P35_003248 [Cladosporium inversicolor]